MNDWIMRVLENTFPMRKQRRRVLQVRMMSDTSLLKPSGLPSFFILMYWGTKGAGGVTIINAVRKNSINVIGMLCVLVLFFSYVFMY